ncbi:MAG: hypothetical protein HY815_04170 [Candidatus Riflebacteria bacterium]|nr:hypothetical protein [Candidatus Riflebacteria bacterium]
MSANRMPAGGTRRRTSRWEQLSALATAWGRAAAWVWRRPSRRPVIVAGVLVPLALAVAAWFLTGGPRQVNADPDPAAAAPSPQISDPATTPAFSQLPPRPTDAEPFKKRNPFRLNVKAGPPPSPAPVAPPPTIPQPMQSKVNLADKFTLLGTYVGEETRYAIIREKAGTGKEDVYTVGGRPLPNFLITAISHREVQMSVDGQPAERPLTIDFSDWKLAQKAGPAPPGPPEPGQPPTGPFPMEGAGAGADGQTRKLARQEVDAYLDNLNTLLTQVNIQPVFQGGQPSGFRLTDIQKGTILDQIGIQDGDTLRFVNGQRIDSVQSAFQLYNILKESTNVEITVLRNTRPTTLRYVIY